MFSREDIESNVHQIRQIRSAIRALSDEALLLYCDLNNPSQNLITDCIRLGLLPKGTTLSIEEVDISAVKKPSVLSWGGIDLNGPSLLIRSRNLIIRLTPQESGLTGELIRAQGSIVTREYLGDSEGRAVDVHVRRIRGKLGTDNENLLETVRGFGYKLNPADQN